MIIKDLQSRKFYIVTYGGKYEVDKVIYKTYAIQFPQDELSIELNSEQAITLCKKLKEHLETNGHKI